MLSPERDGQHRLYSSADRTRLRLILRGKRIGLSLDESREIIDMYDPLSDNHQQIQRLLDKITQRREQFLQQLNDIQATLNDLAEVEQKARAALKNKTGVTHAK